jgi:4-hydroxybenzoate polyprenyltransferase
MDFMRRFGVYQRERFPLITYSVLVAVISFAGVSLPAMSQAADAVSFHAWLTAFMVTLSFFFQLRVVDEFKDYVDDSIYRPYRPVPRGVIRLGELAALASVLMLVQAVLAAWRSPRLLPILLLGWGYLALMRFEFFAPAWLKARPLLYLVSHMMIMPLIFLFISACAWLAGGAAAPPGLGGFLALGYANGVMFEVGRKIRAPQDEEPGVESYSALWGRPRAVSAWLLAVVCSSLFSWLAAPLAVHHLWLAVFLLLLTAGALVVSIRFLQTPTSERAKVVATYSSAVTLLIFLALGLAAFLEAPGFHEG